jgi:hypothetical protein
MLGDSDLSYLIKSVGVPMTFVSGGVTYSGFGVVDASDQDLYDADGGQFAGRVTVVKVKAGDFPGIGEGTSVTLDGTAYRVIQMRQKDDGAITDLYCAL